MQRIWSQRIIMWGAIERITLVICMGAIILLAAFANILHYQLQIAEETVSSQNSKLDSIQHVVDSVLEAKPDTLYIKIEQVIPTIQTQTTKKQKR